MTRTDDSSNAISLSPARHEALRDAVMAETAARRPVTRRAGRGVLIALAGVLLLATVAAVNTFGGRSGSGPSSSAAKVSASEFWHEVASSTGLKDAPGPVSFDDLAEASAGVFSGHVTAVYAGDGDKVCQLADADRCGPELVLYASVRVDRVYEARARLQVDDQFLVRVTGADPNDIVAGDPEKVALPGESTLFFVGQPFTIQSPSGERDQAAATLGPWGVVVDNGATVSWPLLEGPPSDSFRSMFPPSTDAIGAKARDVMQACAARGDCSPTLGYDGAFEESTPESAGR
jgi:hypothetical protein